MLVNFKDKGEPIIFCRQDYSDISPIIELVKAKAFQHFSGHRRRGASSRTVPSI